MSAVGDATHFQAARASPLAGLLKVAQVGAHIFYRFGGHAGAPAMFHQTPGASSAPAPVEVARLEPTPKVVQTAVPVDGRFRVTFYPGSASPMPAKPEAAVKLVAAAAETKPALAAPSVPAPLPTPAAKAPEAPGPKPAVISVATLAQS